MCGITGRDRKHRKGWTVKGLEAGDPAETGSICRNRQAEGLGEAPRPVDVASQDSTEQGKGY